MSFFRKLFSNIANISNSEELAQPTPAKKLEKDEDPNTYYCIIRDNSKEKLTPENLADRLKGSIARLDPKEPDHRDNAEYFVAYAFLVPTFFKNEKSAIDLLDLLKSLPNYTHRGGNTYLVKVIIDPNLISSEERKVLGLELGAYSLDSVRKLGYKEEVIGLRLNFSPAKNKRAEQISQIQATDRASFLNILPRDILTMTTPYERNEANTTALYDQAKDAIRIKSISQLERSGPLQQDSRTTKLVPLYDSRDPSSPKPK